MIDYEQLAQESQLFPWLDSDCMSDSFIEEDFFDEAWLDSDEEDFFDEANLFDEIDED